MSQRLYALASFDLLEERFPEQAGTSVQVVFAAPEGQRLRPDSLTGAIAGLAEAPQVSNVGDPLKDGTVTRDGRIGFTEIHYTVSADHIGESDVEALHDAVDPIRQAGFEVAFRGEAIGAKDNPGNFTAEIVRLTVAVVVLLLAFGFAIAAFTSNLSGVLGVVAILISLQAIRRYEAEASTRSDIDGLSDEVEVLELLDDGLAERSVQYLIECGVSPEDAAEVAAREFELSELDLLWSAYQANGDGHSRPNEANLS